MKIEEENSENQKPVINSVVSNGEMYERMQAQIDELTKQKEVKPEGSNETVTAIKQLVAELKEKPDSEKYGGDDTYTRPEDIDPSDRLDDGISFFSHQVAYIIVDDKRSGHNVRTPFGRAIKFAYQSTKAVKHGNETRLHNLSVYTSFSKKEIDWLMEHKFYGTIFFSNHEEALSTDAKKAGKLARIIIMLQRYDVNKVVKIARDLGIPPSENINALRIAIANKQAEDEMVAEDKSNRLKVREAIIEKHIIPEKVVV